MIWTIIAEGNTERFTDYAEMLKGLGYAVICGYKRITVTMGETTIVNITLSNVDETEESAGVA